MTSFVVTPTLEFQHVSHLTERSRIILVTLLSLGCQQQSESAMYARVVFSTAIIYFVAAIIQSRASDLEVAKIDSPLVPGPIDFSVLLPPGYAASEAPLPLLLLLHGGNGSHRDLEKQQAVFDELWNQGALPKLVVAMPSAGRSLYMNNKDGSQQWERFIMGPFLEHIRSNYRVVGQSSGTLIAGTSMGGLGALRMAFKYPDKFAAVVAFEPGILPALTWKQVQPRHRFFRTDDFLRQLYGDPIDAELWEDNNPASIAKHNAERIKESGLKIYLECGDEDYLSLHEGAEFLHRVLWDNGIRHEYHLVWGADHLGRTLKPRFIEGYSFLHRVLDPPGPDPAREVLKTILGEAKKNAESASPGK